MTITTLCRFDKVNADGSHPIVFYVNRNKITTRETCKPGAWDKEGNKLNPRYAGADLVNRRLIKKKAALDKIIETLPEFNIAKIRKLFDNYLDKPDALDEILSKPAELASAQGTFHAFIELIIEEHKTEWSEGYKKRFKSIRTKFLGYDPEFTLEKLTLSWWRDFVTHCVEDLENVNNTINTDAKVISKIVELARDKNYNLAPGLSEISWKYIEPEVMAIEWIKVMALVDLDLRDHHRETYEDSRVLWCLGAVTGRRWEEIERMSEKNFYQDTKKRWRYRSIGKGLKPVDLPLLPEAVALLKKIKFKIPRRAQQTVNADIKEICRLVKDRDGKFLFKDMVLETTITGKKVTEELVEEWKTIHIHTGRHSYAMHIVDLAHAEPHKEKFVSFMLGHASYATTWKYINRRASAHDQVFDKIVSGTSFGKVVAKVKRTL